MPFYFFSASFLLLFQYHDGFVILYGLDSVTFIALRCFSLLSGYSTTFLNVSMDQIGFFLRCVGEITIFFLQGDVEEVKFKFDQDYCDFFYIHTLALRL